MFVIDKEKKVLKSKVTYYDFDPFLRRMTKRSWFMDMVNDLFQREVMKIPNSIAST